MQDIIIKTIFVILILGIIFSITMLVRNIMIFNIREQAIDIYFDKSTKSIGDFDDYSTYNEMMWSLDKWTFKDFYPNMNREKFLKKKKEKSQGQISGDFIYEKEEYGEN